VDIVPDCQIGIEDIQAVAHAWRCDKDGGCHVSAYDFDGDDVITVVDIMAVAARWGCGCGDACYAEHPAVAALVPASTSRRRESASSPGRVAQGRGSQTRWEHREP
jgi:hypothetical protein